MSPAKTSLEKKNIANWWPNRADMGENLISRRQLRSKRDQYWRKLAIYTKNTLFLMSPAKTSIEKKHCKLMTKPRRYGGKSHLATPTQEQTRPMTTETSNLYEKKTVFDMSCKAEPWKNKTFKLMTKPRRYGGKSHPATPTQEQTRPISTVTSNLDKKYIVSEISCKDEPWKNKSSSWWPNRADSVENLIPRRQLRSKRDQYRRKLAIYTKNTLFLISPA